MPLRICPNCSNNLGDQDQYFCSNCGFKLPDTVVQVLDHTKYIDIKNFSKNKPLKVPSKKFSLNFSMFLAFIPLALILFSLSLGIALKLFSETNFLNVSQNLKPYNNSATQNETIEILQTNFSVALFETAKFSVFVPADATFYIEISDFSSAINNLVSKNILTETSVSSAVSLVRPNFAVFKYKNSWNFLFTIKNYDKVNLVLNYLSPKGWKAQLIEDVIVVTNNQQYLPLYKATKLSNNKNLFKSALFTKLNSVLPLEGVFKVIILDDNIKEYKTLLDKTFVPDIVKVFETTPESTMPSFVIKK